MWVFYFFLLEETCLVLSLISVTYRWRRFRLRNETSKEMKSFTVGGVNWVFCERQVCRVSLLSLRNVTQRNVTQRSSVCAEEAAGNKLVFPRRSSSERSVRVVVVLLFSRTKFSFHKFYMRRRKRESAELR